MNRPRFTILDGLSLIGVLAIAFAAVRFYTDSPHKQDSGAIAFWLVLAGMAVVLRLVYRLNLERETRLLVLGLAITFAGAADGLYLAAYLMIDAVAVAVVLGLALVGAVLVAGGIVEGMAADRAPATQDPEEPRP